MIGHLRPLSRAMDSIGVCPTPAAIMSRINMIAAVLMIGTPHALRSPITQLSRRTSVRTGRPRTVDWYARKREQMFESLDRVMREQRIRILRLQDTFEYPVEYLERRRRFLTLGPAIHHSESLYQEVRR